MLRFLHFVITSEILNCVELFSVSTSIKYIFIVGDSFWNTSLTLRSCWLETFGGSGLVLCFVGLNISSASSFKQDKCCFWPIKTFKKFSNFKLLGHQKGISERDKKIYKKSLLWVNQIILKWFIFCVSISVGIL